MQERPGCQGRRQVGPGPEAFGSHQGDAGITLASAAAARCSDRNHLNGSPQGIVVWKCGENCFASSCVCHRRRSDSFGRSPGPCCPKNPDQRRVVREQSSSEGGDAEGRPSGFAGFHKSLIVEFVVFKKLLTIVVVMGVIVVGVVAMGVRSGLSGSSGGWVCGSRRFVSAPADDRLAAA
jgi:hypothetical protein